mmetsp:Transcript_3852/g.15665  ORF Transcript_3852/g.15665 Transcript_3852/m.15665 type:complete len:406 (+) Transcript_3852:926-2143(+)
MRADRRVGRVGAGWRWRASAVPARRTSRNASSTLRGSRSSPRVPAASSRSCAGTSSATPSTPGRTCSPFASKPPASGPSRWRRWNRATAGARFASRRRLRDGTLYTRGAGTSETRSPGPRSTSSYSPARRPRRGAWRSSSGPTRTPWADRASSPPSPGKPSRFECRRGTGSATPRRGNGGRRSASRRPDPRTSCSRNGWRIINPRWRCCPTTVAMSDSWQPRQLATWPRRAAASSPPCFTGRVPTWCGAPWAARRWRDGRGSSRWSPTRHRRTRRSGARRLRRWRSRRRLRPTRMTPSIGRASLGSGTPGGARSAKRRGLEPRRIRSARGWPSTRRRPRWSWRLRRRRESRSSSTPGRRRWPRRLGSGSSAKKSKSTTPSVPERRGARRARRSTRAPRVSSGFAS